MKITLVDIQKPRELFRLLDRMQGPVSCCGIDLRGNRDMEHIICGMADKSKGIPRLELMVSAPGDIAHLLRYMREGICA